MTNFNIEFFSESKKLNILHANTIISKYNTKIILMSIQWFIVMIILWNEIIFVKHYYY